MLKLHISFGYVLTRYMPRRVKQIDVHLLHVHTEKFFSLQSTYFMGNMLLIAFVFPRNILKTLRKIRLNSLSLKVFHI